MFETIAKAVFGSSNDRHLKSLRPIVQKINGHEKAIAALTDDELKEKTGEFRARLAGGETLDGLLPEAFAVVREASSRVLGQRHYDVQLLGGIVLHQGQIAEMRTGEGKTLVATLPAYLNALPGHGVHVVTVNEYLAQRDAEIMGYVYRFLGLSVGVITSNMNKVDRQRAYAADITYGTNSEFGFDYLRDNMEFFERDMVQRPFAFAIIDEVDSILIDEARTPLVISGQSQDNSEHYQALDAIVKALPESTYEHDEKSRTVLLTEEGEERVEMILQKQGMLGDNPLHSVENSVLVHHLRQALIANYAYKRDREYVVKDGAVVIVDEFTGRLMPGRRWDNGLHQAIEAKEGLELQPENQTLATITFQNLFRLYPKLSGMTGTAATEAGEFGEIYNLHVVTIPTHKPVQRVDLADVFYRNQAEKFKGIAGDIQEAYERGQPVLVGTVSIEKSELLSEELTKIGIPHRVLNARYHEKEAHIIAQAGRLKSVTIATNMAGRGTDIQLGGNLEFRLQDEFPDFEEGSSVWEEAREMISAQIAAERHSVAQAGGLLVIGTERHESRRIDNQLRGRSGRQGDPGQTRFFLALDDDLLRIFGEGTMLSKMLDENLGEGEAVESKWFAKAIETSQRQLEQRNYDIRKNLVAFDDVLNDQRKVIYEQRMHFLRGVEEAEIRSMIEEAATDLVTASCPADTYPEQWNIEEMKTSLASTFGINLPLEAWISEDKIDPEIVLERVLQAVQARFDEQKALFGESSWKIIEMSILIEIMDILWRQHLVTMEALRSVIGLRAYGQRKPLIEYQREAYVLFESLLTEMSRQAVAYMFTIQKVDRNAQPVATETTA